MVANNQAGNPGYNEPVDEEAKELYEQGDSCLAQPPLKERPRDPHEGHKRRSAKDELTFLIHVRSLPRARFES